MSQTAKHYFESHVTIEPVFDQRLVEAGEIAVKYKFKIASLLMKKREEDTEERSKYDTFMTGHGKDYLDIQGRMAGLIRELKETGFTVWRYKIEDTVMDSRIKDELGLLMAKNTCTHTKTNQRWVVEENWYTGETEGHWDLETVSTQEDIDLHRFQCTQCGEIGYYSGRARDYYEKGIKSDIRGLDGKSDATIR